ncbi:MAG: UPF0182 family protein [Firmicutes bacterium]|nr:UPF0182 family protein [Bacillota bacterium]HXL04119.1 UPF0182 family protein [Bacillota bacterium]
MIKRFLSILVLILLAVIVVFSRPLAGIFTDILWFDNLGYLSAFLIPISSKLITGIIAGLVSFVFLYANLSFTARRIGKSRRVAERYPDAPPEQMARSIRRTFLVFAILAAVLAGAAMSSQWLTVQTFLNRTATGITDPLFDMDEGYYLFVLPFQLIVYRMSISLVVAALVGVLALYMFTGSIHIKGLWSGEGEGAAKFHVGALAAAALFLKAWGYRLQALTLVYSTRGVVFGAGFTDVHALLPGLRILAVLAIVLGILVLVSVFVRTRKLLITTAVVFVACSFILGGVFPDLVQKFAVEPSELSRETPYIAYNIESTRRAFGLDKITVKSLDVNNDLTFETLAEEHKDTIENIRLWDWRSLGQTYGQLQEIRAYYDFYDIDLDRYPVGDRTLQMALSARELSLSLLPSQARTWVSEHLVYTHGYGLAMSPTGEVSKEGLPKFTISDIPPRSSYPGFDVTRPELYYGEKTDSYVIVNTASKEFDYPEGDSNAYTVYEGTGGVQLSSLIRRIAFALRFGTSKLLFSADIGPESRVLFDRNIKDRVKKIAPFLKYDEDPYLVLVDGRLFWMWDAYTVSRLYPYSQPTYEGFNYIRNSAKIVIDAYSGDVTFYLFDPSDPIAKTLSKIFKGLFKPFDDMPDALKAHVRYPADLFEIQSRVLCLYHMTRPDTFYNTGDSWEFPVEVYGQERVEVSPYYVFMKTPGEEQAEYLLILPFVPSGKDNMIGWLMARCDVPRLGELVLYTFPKDRLVYGPMQVESRIDQHPEISQALTLWSQRGSKVVRGNLLVIPIERSLLYVEPLYLLAERSELPELRRVIVAFGDSVAMGNTLEDALRSVFAAVSGDVRRAEVRETVGSGLQDVVPKAQDLTVRALVEDAIRAYEEADKYLSQGDFAGFGESLAELGRLLEELKERTE